MEVRSLGKTKRSGRQERVRGACHSRRGSDRGSQAVYKVREEGKAASKEQIPFAPAAEESQKESRGSPVARTEQRGPRSLALLSFEGFRSLLKEPSGNHSVEDAVGAQCRKLLVGRDPWWAPEVIGKPGRPGGRPRTGASAPHIWNRPCGIARGRVRYMRPGTTASQRDFCEHSSVDREKRSSHIGGFR
jgi:hypothetical protein